MTLYMCVQLPLAGAHACYLWSWMQGEGRGGLTRGQGKKIRAIFQCGMAAPNVFLWKRGEKAKIALRRGWGGGVEWFHLRSHKLNVYVKTLVIMRSREGTESRDSLKTSHPFGLTCLCDRARVSMCECVCVFVCVRACAQVCSRTRHPAVVQIIMQQR